MFEIQTVRLRLRFRLNKGKLGGRTEVVVGEVQVALMLLRLRFRSNAVLFL